MKAKKFSVLSVAFVAVVAFTGCSTTSSSSTQTESQAQRLERIASLAAYTGAALRLVDHPDERPRFQAAADALGVLESGSADSAILLQRVLATLPMKEMRGEKGAILIGAAIMLYESEVGRLTPIDQASMAATVARSIRAGITNALAQFPPPAK